MKLLKMHRLTHTLDIQRLFGSWFYRVTSVWSI